MTDDRLAREGAAEAAGEPARAEAADAAERAGSDGLDGIDEAAGAGEAAGTDGRIEDAPAPMVIRRRGRRVSTEPSPGYTGEPPTERQQSSENDARLWGDLPPHWGKR